MSPAATVRAAVPASRRPPAPGGGGRGRRRDRLRRALRRAAPALLGYLAVRLCGLLVLARWAHRQGARRLADAGHVLGLRLVPGHRRPWLRRRPRHPVQRQQPRLLPALSGRWSRPSPRVTPGSRATVGLLLAVGFSFVAAWGVFAVGDRLYGRRVGTLLTVLWGVLPVAMVQWMGYTESMFTALAAWALYAVLTGRWLWAASLASLAGLTRPTGIARRGGRVGGRAARRPAAEPPAAAAPLSWRR